MVGRIVVVRRDRHRHVGLLGRLEQAPDVGHRAVVLDALADDAPGHAVGAQEVDLRIGHDKRGPLDIEREIGRRQCALGGIGIGAVGRLGAPDADRSERRGRGDTGRPSRDDRAAIDPLVVVGFTHG